MSATLNELDESTPSETQRLTACAVYDLLSNERRQCVLCFLLEEPQTTVRSLSRQVAAWENDIPVADVSSKQRKRVYTGLHQTHLPRLDDHGVITYDSDRGQVRATERLASFEPYLRHREVDTRPWPLYYASIGVGAVALAVGMLVGLPGLVAVEPPLAMVLVGLAVVITAALQFGSDGREDTERIIPDIQPVSVEPDSRPAD